MTDREAYIERFGRLPSGFEPYQFCSGCDCMRPVVLQVTGEMGTFARAVCKYCDQVLQTFGLVHCMGLGQ